MKIILFIIIISEVELLVSSGVNDYSFMPNLQMGPYESYIKAIFKCPPLQNPLIQFNYYMYKISENAVQLRGNMTFKVPLDDSLTMNLNFAIKDSIGGWKDNAHIIVYPKTCTSMKNIFGVQWKSYLNSFGITDLDCPIKPGVYVNENGFIINIKTIYFPKIFFYGTYKIRVYSTNTHGRQMGCVVVIVEIKRPWEIA